MTLAAAFIDQRDFPIMESRTPLEILEFVAADGHVTLTQIRSPRRPQHVAHVRQLAMYMIREHTGLSFPKIGRMLGNRDHSTVIHAVNLIHSRIEAQPAFAATVRRMNAELVGL